MAVKFTLLLLAIVLETFVMPSYQVSFCRVLKQRTEESTNLKLELLWTSRTIFDLLPRLDRL